jgi:hypothetical protein
VPAMAAARAAVKDSTSSEESIRFQFPNYELISPEEGTPTYQNHDEAVFSLSHLHNAPE